MKFEIWLDDNFSHFNRGILHTDSGKMLKAREWLGLAPSGVCRCALSCHPCDAVDFLIEWICSPSNIDICRWDSEVESFLIHNDSGKEIVYEGSRILAAGERREIRSEELARIQYYKNDWMLDWMCFGCNLSKKVDDALREGMKKFRNTE